MPNRDILERLRWGLNLHWAGLVALEGVTLHLLFFRPKAMTSALLILSILSPIVLAIKEYLFRSDMTLLTKYAWLSDLFDLLAVSLLYYMGFYPLNFLFFLYLLLVFLSAREIFPGELKFMTILTIISLTINLWLLRKNWVPSFYRLGSFPLSRFFVYCYMYLTIILIGYHTYALFRVNQQLISRMEVTLAENKKKIRHLYESNTTLEEKYASSYTLTLIQQYIFQELNESQLLMKITDIIQGILGSSVSAILGLSPEQDLVLLSFSGVKDFSPLLTLAIKPGSLLYRALKQQTILNVNNTSPQEKMSWQKEGIKSLLCIPLLTAKGKLGVMMVGHFQEEIFSQEQKDLLQIIANQVSLAMENMRLHQEKERMAWHDQLTGLYNRGYLNNYLALLEEEYAQRLHLACLLIDIDHFKLVNDHHGHLMGDQVLKKISSVLQERFPDCVPTRYGGEEFILFSTDRNIQELLALSEEVRAEIAALKFIGRDESEFSITISGGIAAIPDHTKTIERLLMKADDALYQAKSSGRNRVLIYRPPMAEDQG